MKTYIIDGAKFNNLQGFYKEISDVLIPGHDWGHNLDAFNDILRGGFGTPEEGFTIHWKNSNKSRKDLGYKETIKWLEEGLSKVHPSNIPSRAERIKYAKMNRGETLFMELVSIILGDDNIQLILD